MTAPTLEAAAILVEASSGLLPIARGRGGFPKRLLRVVPDV
jgi:hypothetical protein